MDRPLSSASSSNNSLNHNRSPRSSPLSTLHHHYQRSSPSPPPKPEPLNLQTRRLQLRNARFQATSISPSKVSDRFSTWRSVSPSSDISVDKENQPASPNEQKKPSESVRRRVSILQEIHDSSQRGRKLRRPSVSRLFGPPLDDSEFSLGRRQPYRSPSTRIRPSSGYSILADSDAESMMGTYQNRSSPLSSDTLHQNRLRSNSRNRSTSYATERYIEHLETQLAAAQTQLSPMQASAVKPQTSKLRSLSAELKVLRQEISEWEDKFDVRVHEEVALRTDIEGKLRTKIIFLEGQLEDYTTRFKELECERDLQAQKLRNVESLRTTNRGLERRIDVLTELLAQSPTKIEPRSPSLSPTRSPGPRLSRPKSMLPSVPLRTDLVYQPLVDPTLNGDPEAGIEKHSPEDVPDLILDDSTVASSAAASKSQRSSTISHPSSASSRWSVPLPFSPELQGKTPGRSRNMRRFPSGTCSLKPLILPTTTTPTPTSPQRQSLSSEHYPSIYSPYSDREMPECASTAQEETLAALEGRTGRYQTFDEIMSEPEDDAESPLSRRMRSGSHVSSENYHQFSSTLYSELQEAERGNLSIRSQVRRSHLTTNPSTPMASCRLKVHSSRSGSYSTPKAYNNPYDAPASASTTHSKLTKSLSTRSRSVPGVFHELRTSFGTFARTLIAGIWQKSMGRLGKLSWWILGILLGPQQRDDWLKGSSLRMQTGEWTTGTTSSVCYTCGQSPQHARENFHRSANSNSKDNNMSDALGRTLFMWTKLSVAIALAFGRAIRYGPESVLKGEEEEEEYHRRSTSSIMRYNSPPQTTSTNYLGYDGIDEHDFPADDAVSEGYTTWTRPLTAEDFFTS